MAGLSSVMCILTVGQTAIWKMPVVRHIRMKFVKQLDCEKNVIFHLHIFYICLPKHLARCLSRPSFFTECQHWSWPWHRLALLFCCDYRSALELLHDSSLQESVLLSIVEIVNDEWLFRSLWTWLNEIQKMKKFY